MKILQLNLLAFGPFTDEVLDLSAGDHGLHMIYGPNEAGKSSALRAIRQMLYGIDTQTVDGFIHPYQNLRVGGQLRHSDGSQLEFLRRKGRKDTVRDAADQSPLSDAELARYLGGISSDIFRTMFGIDHQRLTEGGQQIVDGQGELGEILFLAGSGITQLQSVRNGFEEQMGELFKPSGRKPRINQALAELRENHKEIRRIQLSSGEWLKHRKAHDAADEETTKIENQLGIKEKERSRLERIQQAVPKIAKLCQRKIELKPVADAVLLPTDFPERRRQAELALALAAEKKKTAEEQIAELTVEIQDIDVPTELLAQAEQVDSLYLRLGSVRKALEDKPKLEEQRRLLELDAQEILHDLRPGYPMEQVEELRLNRTDLRRIRDQGNERAAVFAAVTSADNGIKKSQRDITKLQTQLQETPKVPDPTELQDRYEAIRGEGKLEAKLIDEQQADKTSQTECKLELSRLGLWSGSLADLEKLAIPGDETVNRFETDLDAVSRTVSDLKRDRGQHDDELRNLKQELETIRIDQQVPTENELSDARNLRESGWQLVRRAWLGGDDDSSAIEEFATKFDNAANLPQAYERSVERADTIGDRLRREAENVAKRAGLEASLQTQESKRTELKAGQEKSAAEQRRLKCEWEQLWPGLDGKPLPPREMRAWIINCRGLLEKAAALRNQSHAVRAMQETIDGHRQDLARLIAAVHEPPPEAASLGELLDFSRRVVKSLTGQQQARLQLETDLHNLQEQSADDVEVLRRMQNAKAEWNEAWAGDMQLLGMEPTATPAGANLFLDGLDDLFQKRKEAGALALRIAQIDNDAKSFADDVQSFVASFADDLADLPAESAIVSANERVSNARAAQLRLETLHKDLKSQNTERDTAVSACETNQILLTEMCREASCKDPAELPTAEDHSASRRQAESAIAELEDELREISGGSTLEEFLKEAEAADPDTVKFEIDQIAGKTTELRQARDRQRDTIRDEEHAISQMDGSAAAAELAEKSQEIIAGLESDVEHYVRLKLALALLKEGIKRYQENNQTPVLQRTGELFRRLTLGSFTGLRDEYDDSGRAVLAGIRAEKEESVYVKQMSDGTRDQLYLALRIAGIESYLDRHEPLPFIVDDVLLNFDDDRAIAGLESLAELSKRTQVIFFTHHRHLVDLAESRLPKSVLTVHQLNT